MSQAEVAEVGLPAAVAAVADGGLGLGDLGAEATVAAARDLLAEVASGGVPAHAAEPLVGALVGIVGSVETLINALTARRAALLAVAAAVVQAHPGTMVPLLPDAEVTVRDHDHARRALVADVATASGASEVTTATRVDTSVVLTESLPGVLTAMAEGRMGEPHARHVVRHTQGLPAEALGAYEQDVLTRLRAGHSPARVNALARAARERCHPQTLAERHRQAAQDRAVYLDPAPDGMAWLGALLPAVQAHAIFDKLTGIGNALRRADGETRTLAQCRADALTALTLDTPPAPPCTGPGAVVEGSGVEGAGDDTGDASISGEDPEWTWQLDPALRSLRPQVAVTVPVMTLLGVSEEPGSLEGYGPIDPRTARLLAAHAPSFLRILTHPETGATLSVGRQRYTVPADLRAWLRHRDGTCRFPGCPRPAARCEIDHTTPFREGGSRGATDATNLAHLCPKHHRLKHTTRWHAEHLPDAQIEWTSPTGQHHRTAPTRAIPQHGLPKHDPPPPDRGPPRTDNDDAAASEQPDSDADPPPF